jgi:hypothetical protein
MRRLPLILLAALALSGCAVAGADTSAGATGSTGAPARTAAGLPRSTASSHVVQRQPAPGACHARGTGLYSLPDPRCTPGAIDPTVTQGDIGRTVCRSGYTETVRPPESVTETEKRASLRAYGDHHPLHYYEYDHLVSLELGGARNDARNLWPEPGASPNPKDSLEDRLHTRVCDGDMSLAAAQLAIARNWVAAYRRLG